MVVVVMHSDGGGGGGGHGHGHGGGGNGGGNDGGGGGGGGGGATSQKCFSFREIQSTIQLQLLCYGLSWNLEAEAEEATAFAGRATHPLPSHWSTTFATISLP